jgi:4-amino-4-deoxy-L-arabinose transferase-like glycosyltransferase
MKGRETVTQALAVGIFLLSVYLLTYSGRFHSSDGQAMFAVTESLVRRGDYDINQLLWMGQQQGTYGLDGELYCRKGIATSLLSLPLAWMGLVAPFWGMVQTTLLFNALVTALTGLLVYLYVKRLGYPASASLVLSLVFGLATLAWPYAKYFFSDPLAGLGLFGTAYFLLRYRDNGRTSDTLWAGTSLGLAVATRFANIITFPLFGLLLLAYIRTGDKGQGARDKYLPPILAFALPLALTALLLGGYNYARYGDVLQTGYLPQEKFSTPWLEGISGLLVSPGRGLFLYAPILLVSLLTIPAFVRRHRLEAALALLVSASYVLLYSRWFFWHAGYAWGPRFLVPILPFAVILMAPLVEKLSGKGWLAFAALCLVSVAIQILGLSVDFTLFQEGLLFRFKELRMFDPRTYFEFRFSPLLGQWALLRLENLDFAWVRMMGSPPYLQVDWPVLISNVALVIATALGLRWFFHRERGENPRREWRTLILMGLLAFIVTAFSLSRYKDDQHRDYQELVSYLEAHSQPGDAIIFNIPTETAVLQNHYKGHLPVYGLLETSAPVTPATAGLLDKLAMQHPGLWLIPSTSLAENGLDQHLREQGYQADDESFDDLRLILYAFPRNPLTRHTGGAVFGEAIVLEGYALDEGVQAGDVLHLDLYWQASTPVAEDYQVFIHLVGEDSQRWAQKDGPPLLGARPTSSWQPGEQLTDRRGLLLPSDMPSGSYHLRLGLYRLSDGSRLLTTEGADGLDLDPFTVTAGE